MSLRMSWRGLPRPGLSERRHECMGREWPSLHASVARGKTPRRATATIAASLRNTLLIQNVTLYKYFIFTMKNTFLYLILVTRETPTHAAW